MSNAFGRYLRECREELRVSLRAFALAIGLDPSNYSKIERGILCPPDDDALLERIADALELQPDSAEWQRLFDLASVSRGEVPQDLLNNEAVAAALPAFFQRVRETGAATPHSLYAALVHAVTDA